MGHFLAVSAFRDRSVQSVSDAVVAYAKRFDCDCEPATGGEPDDSRDALVFPPENGWTAILWPSYFNIHDIELCRNVSSALAAIVSTVHVYDGDYWTHALIESGTVRDVFASMPYYFADVVSKLSMPVGTGVLSATAYWGRDVISWPWIDPEPGSITDDNMQWVALQLAWAF